MCVRVIFVGKKTEYAGRPRSREWCCGGASFGMRITQAPGLPLKQQRERSSSFEVLTTNREVLIGSGEPEFSSETDDRGAAPVLILRTVLKMQLVAGLTCYLERNGHRSDAKGFTLFERSSFIAEVLTGRERSSPARLRLPSGSYHLI